MKYIKLFEQYLNESKISYSAVVLDKKSKEKSEAKKGLWENIRDKKRRMGKNYRPAKPGDKDRPSKEALKKAQKSSKKKKM